MSRAGKVRFLPKWPTQHRGRSCCEVIGVFLHANHIVLLSVAIVSVSPSTPEVATMVIADVALGN